MSDRILDDVSLHPLRVCQCHAKANRPTVVLHIQRVVRQAHRLREIVDHGRDVVERIIEQLRVRPVAVSEARVIGRDKVITIGKPGEERLELRDEEGNPCSRRSVGASFGPASL